MATDAMLTGIQFNRPEGPIDPDFDLSRNKLTQRVDDRKRTMTITYEWFGRGIPDNLPQIVKDHPELTNIDFGAF